MLPSKHLYPSSLTDSGNDTLFKLLQELNALSPMLSITGTLIEERFLHSLNTYAPIEIHFGSSIFSNFVQLENAP